MSIEGAVADRDALAETLADILDRWVPAADGDDFRFMMTIPVGRVTYDGWRDALDKHGPDETGGGES